MSANDDSGDEALEEKLKLIAMKAKVKPSREPKFICPVQECAMFYKSAFGLKYHLKRVHRDLIDQLLSAEPAPRKERADGANDEESDEDEVEAKVAREEDAGVADASAAGHEGRSKKAKMDDGDTTGESTGSSQSEDASGSETDDDGEEDGSEQTGEVAAERNRQRRARSQAYFRRRFAILHNRRRKRRKKLLTIASERSNSKLVQLKRNSNARIEIGGGPSEGDIFARADNLISVDEPTQTVTVALLPGGKCFSFSVFDELPVVFTAEEPVAASKPAVDQHAEPETTDREVVFGATTSETLATESAAAEPALPGTPLPKDADGEATMENTPEREPSSTTSSPRRRIKPVFLSPVPPKTPKKDEEPQEPLTPADAARRAAEMRTASARNAALARWRRSTKSASGDGAISTQASLPLVSVVGTSLPSGFKVPECKFRVIDDETRARRRAKASAEAEAEAAAGANVYYRHVERTDEELDETVEYDMDDQDAAWLALLNEQRAALSPSPGPLSDELFERLLDRFEKDSHFEQLAIPTAGGPAKNAEQTHEAVEDDQLEEHEAVCCICLDGECENSNAILFCDLCNLPVHQDCYGVPYIPEGQWLCRRCQLSPSRSVDCCLCPLKGGAFKLVADADSDAGLASASSPTRAAFALSPTLGAAASAFPFGLVGAGGTDANAAGSARWAHVVCALWIPEVAFANTVFLEPIIDVHRIPASRWRLTCYLCKQRNVGACIQCSKPNCYTAFHVTCAQQAGLCMKIAPIAGTACVKKTAFCDLHTPPSLAFSSMMPADAESLPTPATPAASAVDADADSECAKSQTKAKTTSKALAKCKAESAVSSSASFASGKKSGKVERESTSTARSKAAARAGIDTNEADSGSQAGSMTAERLERLALLRRRVLTERRAQQATINIPVIAKDKLARLAQRCSLPDSEDGLMRRLYAYWQLKRLARCGVALLRRLQVQTRSRPTPAPAPERRRRERDSRSASVTPAISQACGDLAEQVKMWSRLRRDFEKLRLLVELVRKREKLKRELLRVEQRCALLTVQPFVLFARRLVAQLDSFDTDRLFCGDSNLVRTRFKLTTVDARSIFACTSVNLRTISQRIDAAEYATLDQLHADVSKMVVHHRRLDSSSRFHAYVDRFGKQADTLLAEARKTMLANGGYDPFTALHCEHALLQGSARRYHNSPPASAGLDAHAHPHLSPLAIPHNGTRSEPVLTPGSVDPRPAVSFSAYRNTEAIRLDSDEEEDSGRVRTANVTNSSPLCTTPKRSHLSPSHEHSDSDTNDCEADAVQPVKSSPLRSGHPLFEAVRLQPAASQPLFGGQFALPKATKLDIDNETDATNQSASATDLPVKDNDCPAENVSLMTQCDGDARNDTDANQPVQVDVALRVETAIPSCAPSVSGSGNLSSHTFQSHDSDFDTDRTNAMADNAVFADRDAEPMDDCDLHASGLPASRKRQRSSASTCDSHSQSPPLQRFDFVWAKVSGHPFFPAIVIHGTQMLEELKMSPEGWITYHSARFPAPPNNILELAAQFDSTNSASTPTSDYGQAGSKGEAHYLVLFFDTKQTWTWVTRSKLAPLGDVKRDQQMLLSAKNKKATVKKAYDRAFSDLNKIRSFELRFPTTSANFTD